MDAITQLPDPFTEGSIAAANAIIVYLHRAGFGDAATAVHQAWENDSLVQVASPGSFAPVPPPQPKITRDQARNQGFTGNSCLNCQSMAMKVSGHCEVCSDCGTTTGCS
jgi:hypothetical protein